VSDGPGTVAISRLRRPLITKADIAAWLPQWSLPAAMRAVRATVVVAGLFALTDKVIGNLQMATFAAFGGFATLVLASFAGTRREKLVAHACLALAGSALVTIGTAVSSSTALAASVTVPVTFAVFFSGVAGPNAASGVTGALLAYVLPAASPGTIGMVPDRLAGWWLASAAGTAAVMILSPRPGGDGLRAAASSLSSGLAGELRTALEGPVTEERLGQVISAKQELLAEFNSTPYRPTGLTGPDQALANGVELLEWCTSLVVDALRERGDLREASPDDRKLVASAASVLDNVASIFAGEHIRVDLDAVESARNESLARLHQSIPTSRQEAQISFHAHAIALAAIPLAAEAMVAERIADPDWLERERRRWLDRSSATARATRRVWSVTLVALSHASLRSVWFVNSLRGALALAAAVAVADLGSVQHGFWVVLGTLSVLRTNAASTGSTAARALAGTAVGFMIGGALLVAIGSSSTALWIALPVAVFVAAYAPGTAPFAVGQAAFTVTVAVLFNLLVPVGWQVGVVRIEDVAIGCAVSIVVGSLFWPHGVASVVGDDLADAFRTGASYLTEAVDWASGFRAARPDLRAALDTTAIRLDEALRGFLAEQGAKHIDKHALWRLVGGSLRLRLTATAVADLPGGASGVDGQERVLRRRTRALSAWYEQLAELVGRPHGRGIAPLEPPQFGGDDEVDSASSHYAVWLCEHLDHLGEHLGEMIGPATRVAELRRRPWWR
jgi:uncharacterized membrane protein YccC